LTANVEKYSSLQEVTASTSVKTLARQAQKRLETQTSRKSIHA